MEDNAQLCKKKGGRPKESTQAASENTKERKLAALNHAAIEFQKEKQNRGGNGQVKKGVYERIIEETLKLFVLPEDSISKETVRSYLGDGRNLMVAHLGPYSPMIAIWWICLQPLLQ